MGPAKHTLTSLDISETFIQDGAIEHICKLSNLRKLFLNQCIFLTEASIKMIGQRLLNIRTLSLNFFDLPLSKLLPLLVGESPEEDPLPQLEKIYFESFDWEKYVDSIVWFIANRKHIESLRICAALPKLELGTNDYKPFFVMKSAHAIHSPCFPQAPIRWTDFDLSLKRFSL